MSCFFWNRGQQIVAAAAAAAGDVLTDSSLFNRDKDSFEKHMHLRGFFALTSRLERRREFEQENPLPSQSFFWTLKLSPVIFLNSATAKVTRHQGAFFSRCYT
jgi:hypothetical protein